MTEKLAQLSPVYAVGTQEYKSTLDEDLFINRNDLNSEFASHAEKFAYYSTCYELAADQLRRYEVQLKRMYAIVDANKRAELINAGVKFTEKMIENSVITDADYTALQEEVLQAERNLGLLKAARDSMAQRKEMLVSIGANQRTEFRADASLISKEVRARG